MEYRLFIDKYRPILFQDFVINSSIIDILKTFIEINNINIILIGPNGSGKTTLIDCIIKEYHENIHFKDIEKNILKINNLKDNGIQYFRNDVKVFCQTTSLIHGKKKIIILDDLDSIGEQSQQVFRNFIDKYSHNVHFIASCNNIHKIIEGLKSRLNIIKLNPLTKDNIFHIMETIINKEHLSLENNVKDFIINISNNNAKIVINYLEKFKILNEHITLDIAKEICTNISFVSLQEYTYHIKQNNLIEAIKILYSISGKGYSNIDILDSYFTFIKITDLYDENEKYNIIPILCKYISIFYSINEEENELALFTNEIIKIIHSI